MATVTPIFLDDLNALFDSSTAPKRAQVQGSNFPVKGLDFDATTDKWAYWLFRVVQYGSGNWSIDVDWEAVNASSGNIVWQAKLAKATPNTDSNDIETLSFGSINYVQDTHLGTTGKRLHRCTITLSNLQSVADGDWVCLGVGRDADSTNATDDMANDGRFLDMAISYSDT